MYGTSSGLFHQWTLMLMSSYEYYFLLQKSLFVKLGWVQELLANY